MNPDYSQNLQTRLFLIHCGYYDTDVLDGNYESHVNFFVAAKDFDDARARIRLNADFQRKRMHVDGLQEIRAVDGHRLALQEDAALEGATLLVSNKHRDLAPKKPVLPSSESGGPHASPQ